MIKFYFYSTSDQPVWRENIRQQMEEELNRRVREALETPPLERALRHKAISKEQRINDINSHINLEFERNFFKNKRWQALQARQHLGNCVNMSYLPSGSQVEFMFHDELSRSNHDEYPGVYGLESCSEGLRNIRDNFSSTIDKLSPLKPKFRHYFTKEGFLHAIRTGELPNGFVFLDELGTYRDKYGIIRNEDGPFWPSDFSPLHATPRFKWFSNLPLEPLWNRLPGECVRHFLNFCWRSSRNYFCETFFSSLFNCCLFVCFDFWLFVFVFFCLFLCVFFVYFLKIYSIHFY